MCLTDFLVPGLVNAKRISVFDMKILETLTSKKNKLWFLPLFFTDGVFLVNLMRDRWAIFGFITLKTGPVWKLENHYEDFDKKHKKSH